ncbi:MAG: hypothetical protein R3211_03635 [Balneolaceae bacterium]|nr:hypothetical protein [Balneolaceae bacterium]
MAGCIKTGILVEEAMVCGKEEDPSATPSYAKASEDSAQDD